MSTPPRVLPRPPEPEPTRQGEGRGDYPVVVEQSEGGRRGVHALRTHWMRLVVIVLAFGFVAFGARTFVAKKRAEHALLHFADHLSQTRAALTNVDAVAARQQLDRARADLQEARSSRSALGVRLLAHVPGTARITRSYDAFMVVAGDLYESADRATHVEELVKGSTGGPKLLADRRIDFVVLDQVRSEARSGLAALERARGALDTVTPVPIFHGIGRAKVVVADQIARSQKDTRVVADVLDKLPAMLGRDGPRTYFFAMQNSAEARGSGGGLLSVALIRVNPQGQIDFENKGSIYFVENEDVSKRQYFDFGWPADDYWSQTTPDTRRLGNANWSPNFPTVGHNIVALYRLQAPEHNEDPSIDGVIAVTPEFLSRVLRATGPISIDGVAQPITADTLIPFILHDAYERYGLDQQSRRQINAELVSQAANRVFGGPDLGRLLKEFGRSVPDRSVQVYLARPEEEKLIAEASLDGAIPATDGDFGMWLRNNSAGNKVDFFIRHHIDQEVTIDPSGTAHEVVTNTLVNPAPPNPGPPGSRNNEYLDHFSDSFQGVYLPGRAVFEGFQLRMPELETRVPVVNHEAGKTVIVKGGRVVPQTQGSFVVRYSLPGAVVPGPNGTLAYTVTRMRPARLDPDVYTLRVRLPEGAVPVNPSGWTQQADGTWQVDAQITGISNFTLFYRLP